MLNFLICFILRISEWGEPRKTTASRSNHNIGWKEIDIALDLIDNLCSIDSCDMETTSRLQAEYGCNTSWQKWSPFIYTHLCCISVAVRRFGILACTNSSCWQHWWRHFTQKCFAVGYIYDIIFLGHTHYSKYRCWSWFVEFLALQAKDFQVSLRNCIADWLAIRSIAICLWLLLKIWTKWADALQRTWKNCDSRNNIFIYTHHRSYGKQKKDLHQIKIKQTR